MPASKIPKFYISRYHPVDFTQKLVYLDPHPTAAACSLRPGCEARIGKELTERWSLYLRDGFRVIEPPIPSGSEDLVLSRYHPIDVRRKLIYLDAFPKPQECEAFPGCSGMLGSEVRLRWTQFMKKNYKLIARQLPENRGGAGRGQGPPSQGLGPTAKLRVPGDLHEAITKLAKASTQRKFVSEMLDNVDDASSLLRFLANPVSTVGAKQLVLNESDFDRLDSLIGQLRPETPLLVTRASLLAAIVLAEKSKRRKK